MTLRTNSHSIPARDKAAADIMGGLLTSDIGDGYGSRPGDTFLSALLDPQPGGRWELRMSGF